MSTDIDFDAISGVITQKTKVESLYSWDKVNLFRYLMDNLGITRRLLIEDPDSKAIKIIDEQCAQGIFR